MIFSEVPEGRVFVVGKQFFFKMKGGSVRRLPGIVKVSFDPDQLVDRLLDLNLIHPQMTAMQECCAVAERADQISAFEPILVNGIGLGSTY